MLCVYIYIYIYTRGSTRLQNKVACRTSRLVMPPSLKSQWTTCVTFSDMLTVYKFTISTCTVYRGSNLGLFRPASPLLTTTLDPNTIDLLRFYKLNIKLV